MSNHFNPLSLPPYFLHKTNVNATSFQGLRYFTSLMRHRSHIPCWKPDSKLYIRRFSHHSNTSALNFSSGIQCCLSNVGRYLYCLLDILSIPQSILWGIPCIATTIIKQKHWQNFNCWMPFLTLTKNQRMLETQFVIAIPPIAFNQPRIDSQRSGGIFTCEH